MPTVFDLCFSRFRRYYQGAEGCFRVLMPAFEAISWFCYQWVTIHFRSVETESAGKAPGLLIATDLQGNLTAWRTKCQPQGERGRSAYRPGDCPSTDGGRGSFRVLPVRVEE